MKRIEAVQVIMGGIHGALWVHATGMISREAFAQGDRPESFYMIGSMGLNSAIGVGLALNLPNRTVAVLDGDGSLLMNLGILATVGELGLSNFVHFVLDNASYASTGGQPSISNAVELERIAAAAGYKHTCRIREIDELRREVAKVPERPKPLLLLVEVAPGNESEVARVDIPPPQIAERFRQEACRR
jgi:thiamine pyrophosphate-dependent acetolactate synthase large subunit-like protein